MSFVRLDSVAVGTAANLASGVVLASDFQARGGCERPRRASQEARLEIPWPSVHEGREPAQGCSWNCRPSRLLSLKLNVGN
jgi:hypothetical protein